MGATDRSLLVAVLRKAVWAGTHFLTGHQCVWWCIVPNIDPAESSYFPHFQKEKLPGGPRGSRTARRRHSGQARSEAGLCVCGAWTSLRACSWVTVCRVRSLTKPAPSPAPTLSRFCLEVLGWYLTCDRGSSRTQCCFLAWPWHGGATRQE